MSEDASENPHLIEELEQYRRLLDNIPAEIGVFDPEGRFLFNTPSGIRHAGTREWVLGKTHHDWCRKRGHPMAIADRRQQVIETCVREKRGESFEELWIDRRDGHRRHYLRTFSPVLDSRGEVSHVIGFGQEITELKKVEEELREALSEVAALQERLEAENVYLREEISAHHDVDGIVGFSAPLENVLEAIATVGPTQANVVIYGETGTGKELVARALHAASEGGCGATMTNKTHIIRFVATRHQKDRLFRDARMQGYVSVSNYLRDITFNQTKILEQKIIEIEQSLALILEKLNGKE